MPEPFKPPSPPRIGPLVGGVVCGFFGTFVLEGILLAIAGALSQGSGGLGAASLIIIAVMLLAGGIIAILRVSKEQANPEKYFKLGLAAGLCITLLLQGACFGVLATAVHGGGAI